MKVRGNWAAYTGCFELALVLVRFDHVASIIVNANHSIMRPAAVPRVPICLGDRVRLAIPQRPEWQDIGNQIDAPLSHQNSRGRSSQKIVMEVICVIMCVRPSPRMK